MSNVSSVSRSLERYVVQEVRISGLALVHIYRAAVFSRKNGHNMRLIIIVSDLNVVYFFLKLNKFIYICHKILFIFVLIDF